MPFPFPAGRETILLPHADECVGCHEPVELGRDYCPKCDAAVKQHLAVGICCWCKYKLTEATKDEGVCSCGKPLNNPPALAAA